MSTLIASKSLVTVRKASEITGASRSFIRSLMSRGLLKKYSIRTAVYVSLKEFEQLASEGHENVAA